MKIAQINVTYGKASTGRTCKELSDFLTSKGVNVVTFSASCGKKYKENKIFESKISRLKHLMLSRITGLEGYYSFGATKKLVKELLNFNPDIVHLRILHGSYLNYGYLYKKIREMKIPVVWTMHDCWAYTGKCAYYSNLNCFKWKDATCSKCPAKKQYPESLFFDFSNYMYKRKNELFNSISDLHIVTVSDWLKCEVEQSYLNQFDIRRIYNWIDLDVFQPRESNKLKLKYPNRFIILGVASAWSSRKGIDKFIELSKYLADNYLIILIGKCNVRLPNKRIVSVDNISSKNELSEYYSLANVFINFSEEETFGKVAAEAISCGTPVITNSNTANPEIIDNRCGIVLKNGNMEEVLEAIKKIESNKKLFYSNACVKRANKLFNKSINCELYYSLYLDLIDKGKGVDGIGN
ncbi:MAG: glycosyltransferase [Erysipelotrichaceae bacterium]